MLPIGVYLARRWLRARSTAGCCPPRGPTAPLASCATRRKCLNACTPKNRVELWRVLKHSMLPIDCVLKCRWQQCARLYNCTLDSFLPFSISELNSYTQELQNLYSLEVHISNFQTLHLCVQIQVEVDNMRWKASLSVGQVVCLFMKPCLGYEILSFNWNKPDPRKHCRFLKTAWADKNHSMILQENQGVTFKFANILPQLLSFVQGQLKTHRGVAAPLGHSMAALTREAFTVNT